MAMVETLWSEFSIPTPNDIIKATTQATLKCQQPGMIEKVEKVSTLILDGFNGAAPKKSEFMRVLFFPSEENLEELL